MTYTPSDWMDDKILLAKLVDVKRYDKAREHALLVQQVASTQQQTYLNGVLFMLDIMAQRHRTHPI